MHGRRVVDLACGEGYGAAVLGRTAASVVGVDANPDAFEHARLKYTGERVRFERDMVETWTGNVDCVVFLQTIEHVQDPDAVLARLRDLVGPAGVVYVSTPNVLTLAPPGEPKSGNPWHVREYRPEEFRALCARHFVHVDLLGLFHARKLRVHELAIARAGWDAVHARLGLTQPFYERFTPAITVRDFRLRRRGARARAGPAGRAASVSAPRGTLAVVLHSHMPYVEGFGTWPFGEEWLWEAIATSYLPLLDVLDELPGRVTLSVTPVLADQLEAPGALERCVAFLREVRPESHRRDLAGGRAAGEEAALEYSAARYAAAADALAAGDLMARLARHAGWTSAATHPVLPLLATAAGVRLQLATGIAAHRARFGEWHGGLWLPECAHAPWLDPLLEEAGVHATCVDLTDTGLDPHVPLRSPAGPLLVPLDRPALELVWHPDGYPARGALSRHARADGVPPSGLGGRRRALRAGAGGRAGRGRRARVRRAVAGARGGGRPVRRRARHRAARRALARGPAVAARGPGGGGRGRARGPAARRGARRDRGGARSAAARDLVGRRRAT